MATPFEPEIPAGEWERLVTLVKATRPLRDTYEGRTEKYGVQKEWLSRAMAYWIASDGFDWSKCMTRIKSVDHYKINIGGRSVHFVGHFSKDPDAIPLLLLHGWPGSFLEFIDVVKILRESKSPSFSLIVPSLPGYGWSDPPPLDREYPLEEIAQLMNDMMLALGFKSYAAQGGDIGSVLTRILGVKHDACKAVHFNYIPLFEDPTGQTTLSDLSELESRNAGKYIEFLKTGHGYAIMHSTKGATIGYALQSSPVALLAWIGEKWTLAWTGKDRPPSLDTVLEGVSLMWLLDTYPTNIYPYRQLPRGAGGWHANTDFFVNKPMGFSAFQDEVASAPKSWAAHTGNLLFYKYHSRGGHFAAGEEPEAFAADMIECFGKIFPRE